MDRRQSDYSEAPAIGRAVETDSKSYDRVYGMLLGIRVHVSRISAQPLAKLQGFHFNEYEKIDIPREGNHYAPAHHGNYDYKFKTYAPVVFMHLRHLFGITDDEYLVSLTADYMMSELKTIGRSGAMFFYTWDGRYVLKTLTKDELAVLRRILPKYYQYVSTHPDTLVNQFFGVYRSQTSMGRPIRFVIMNNVFPIGFQLKYKFDLKGSTVNRHVAPEKKDKPGVTMKDTEFAEKRYLSIGPRDWTLLRTQLLDDTNFLSSCGLMDYSLLIGIHQFNPDSPIMHPAPGGKDRNLKYLHSEHFQPVTL
ncbi:SAICAR synthase-like protein [Histomonas meleagridis]|nr:SAICAR synthase-like protein [Histomonas meleagridis]